MIQFRVLAARCARGLQVIFATSGNQRAQGMPDARCTRDLMRNVHKKCAHEHTGEAENIRHSLRNGFTAYNALSPVSHVLLPPSTPTSGASGPHVFAVRLGPRASVAASSVHRNPPLVVTTADAPTG